MGNFKFQVCVLWGRTFMTHLLWVGKQAPESDRYLSQGPGGRAGLDTDLNSHHLFLQLFSNSQAELNLEQNTLFSNTVRHSK